MSDFGPDSFKIEPINSLPNDPIFDNLKKKPHRYMYALCARNDVDH